MKHIKLFENFTESKIELNDWVFDNKSEKLIKVKNISERWSNDRFEKVISKNEL